MSRRHAPEEVDLSTLPPPPPWTPKPYDFEEEGADPVLDDLDEIVDATVELDAAPAADVALARGATRGGTESATLWRWAKWATGPRDTPRPGGVFLPGRYPWRATVDLGSAAHRWATDTSSHPEAWKLDQLRPVYATKQNAYDEWEAKIRADMAGRPKALLITGFSLAVLLILFTVIAFIIGAFYVLFGVWLLLVAGLSGWGRHVAPDRGATRGESVAVDENAATAAPDSPRVPGRGEIQDAFRVANAIGTNDEIECEPVRTFRNNGWATTVTLPRGKNAADAIARLSYIAGAFDTIDQMVTMTPDPASNRRVWIWVAETDGLTGMAPTSPLLQAKGTVNVWNGILFGFTVAGKRVKVAAVGTHWLTVGASGSGKSRAFGLLPLGYARDPYTQSILMDPEGFGAWAPYRQVAEVIEGSDTAQLRAMAARLKQVVDEEFPRRQGIITHILATEPKLLPNNEIDAKISRNKRYGCPALLIAVEEAVTLYGCSEPFDATDTSSRPKTIGQVAEEATGEIMRRGRKYAISIALISQKATTNLLPSTITFGATTSFMLGCSKTEQADSVMPGWRALGMTPLKLKPAKPNRPGSGNPGAGYLKGVGLIEPEEDWVLLRSDYADGNDIAAIMGDARAKRLEVWPELLPDYQGPDQGGSPAPAGPDPEPDDDAPPAADAFERLDELMGEYAEGETQLRSVTLIARLRARYPEDAVYGQLTDRGMNRFLRPFGLRTSTVREKDGSKGAGLALSVIQEARNGCHDADEGRATMPEPGAIVAPAGSAEPASDQGCHDATQVGAERPTPSDRPDSAEWGAPTNDRGTERTHLGDLPLSAARSVGSGGFA
jgi:hypothetical protein